MATDFRCGPLLRVQGQQCGHGPLKEPHQGRFVPSVGPGRDEIRSQFSQRVVSRFLRIHIGLLDSAILQFRASGLEAATTVPRSLGQYPKLVNILNSLT